MADQQNATELVIPQLIVGLGNPGKKYERTRHNVGFDAVDLLAKSWAIPLAENKKYQAEFGEGRSPYGPDKIRLLKPLTYMNRSGQSIRSVVDWFKLEPASVLVIYDDMDLPVGRIRLRLAGSAGGHNGMKSAISHLGTQDFPRLRIGIGNPNDSSNNPGDPVVSHVLGKFAPKEAEAMGEVMQWVLSAVEMSLKQGFAKAMTLYNGRSLEI